MKAMTKKLLCIGTGYSAQVIARKLLSNDKLNSWSIYGSYRKQKQAKDLSNLGVIPINYDNLADKLLTVDAILSSIPPDKDGDPVINQYGAI